MKQIPERTILFLKQKFLEYPCEIVKIFKDTPAEACIFYAHEGMTIDIESPDKTIITKYTLNQSGIYKICPVIRNNEIIDFRPIRFGSLEGLGSILNYMAEPLQNDEQEYSFQTESLRMTFIHKAFKDRQHN